MKNSTKIILLSTVIIILSILYVVMFRDASIQRSVDFDDRVSIWSIFAIHLIPLAILMIFKEPEIEGLNNNVNDNLKQQVKWLVLTAIVFVVMNALTVYLPYLFSAFYFYKIVFLIAAPVIIMKYYPYDLGIDFFRNQKFIVPVFITLVWGYLHYFSPFSYLTSSEYELHLVLIIIGALVSFLLNSVLEEIFYRVILQTRLEILFGRWAGILVASILWALWHIGIQSDGGILSSGAVVITAHITVGLFLGYLWSKYRNIWVIIFIHGLMNFPLQILYEIFG